LPVIVYGDNVVYHSDTGDFRATGKVRIYQGTQKLYTTLAEGNMKSGDLYLNKGGRMVDGKSVTDSKWAHYNFALPKMAW
jgi:lipopolysaccharide assembly outer membrane protein LptD (OstA)